MIELAQACGFKIEPDQAITFLPDRVVPDAAQQAEVGGGGAGGRNSGASDIVVLAQQQQPAPQPQQQQPQPKPPGLLSYIVGLLCQNPRMAASIAMLVVAAIVNLYSKTPLPTTSLLTNTSTNSLEL